MHYKYKNILRFSNDVKRETKRRYMGLRLHHFNSLLAVDFVLNFVERSETVNPLAAELFQNITSLLPNKKQRTPNKIMLVDQSPQCLTISP